MKKLTFIILFIVSILLSSESSAQVPAVLKDWARHAGNLDSAFKTPVIADLYTECNFVASYSIRPTSGADIVVIKYDQHGEEVWKTYWTGPGSGRDQASDITQDSLYVYVCGITYFSSATNFDYVTLKLDKSDGSIEWDATYNGTASNYDVATALIVDGEAVFVTGVSNDTAASLNYRTIKYNKTTGAEAWNRAYDYTHLMEIPIDIEFRNDSTVHVVGASQSSLTDWDYANVDYHINGTAIDTVRNAGTSSAFDEVHAAKSDADGYIYITGTVLSSTNNYDINTIKLTPSGTLDWFRKYDNYTRDEGHDLIVDTNGNVYVCGSSKSSTTGYLEFVLLKYSRSGTLEWSNRINDYKGSEAKKLCFDSFGNIVVTGKAGTEDNGYDFLTIAFDEDGDEQWRNMFDGEDHGDDGAEDIASDAFGNIYVTGTATISSLIQTVTIKYSSEYFIEPPANDTPAVANYFYTNYGQITNDTGAAVSGEILNYYTIHHYPQLYFQPGIMSMVFSKIDSDTATTDTLARIDMSFLNSDNPTLAYPINEMTDAAYYNYILPHCPEGISNVHGNEKLIYNDVYPGVDVVFSSNKTGLKMYFICEPFKDFDIGLLFEGQENVQIASDKLQINTAIGSYNFDIPKVYQLDVNNNQISLPWQLSWTIPQSGTAKFTGWGNYDQSKVMVIEISNTSSSSTNYDQGVCWSTYLGGNAYDWLSGIAISPTGNQYVVGTTESSDFPTPLGFTQVFHPNIQACLTRFDIDHKMKWGTYYGGNLGEQEAYDVKCKSNGDVYFVGYTTSSTFPIFAQGAQFVDNSLNGAEGFIVCFDSTGVLPKWSTYFGCTASDKLFSLDFDSNDNLFVTGFASDGNFPNITPSGAHSQSYGGSNDAYIAEFNSNDSLIWRTFIGGSGEDWGSSIKCDANNNVFIHGGTMSSTFPTFNPGSGAFVDSILGGTYDNFLVKFSSLNKREWATLIGGSGDEYIVPLGPPGNSNTIATNSQNDIYVVGTSLSSDFPLRSSIGFYDSTNTDNGGYIMKFSGSNYSNLWSSYISGGHGEENISSIAIDEDNRIFVMGGTSDSALFLQHLSSLYYQDSLSGSHSPYAMDGCMFAFDSLNNLIYGSYFGGYHTSLFGQFITDIAIYQSHIYFTGYTSCTGLIGKQFPFYEGGIGGFIDTSFNGGSRDGFISELCIENVVSVDEIPNQILTFKIFPNPTVNNITLNFNLRESQKISVLLLNNLGQLIITISIKGIVGENKVTQNIADLSEGLYFIELLGEKINASSRFIKMD